jgi:N-acetylmuramoyl-L-alanine amidase
MHPSRVAGFLVVIDAGHGGSETGARIAPNLPEKDLTLSLARKLRQELQSRHIAVVLLRDSDVELSLDQRAIAANLARPALFISIHAEPGTTVRLFTPTPPMPAETLDRGSFLPWQTAQAGFAGESRAFAAEAAAAVNKRQVTVQIRPAFLQPLHSIAAPAIAIEVPAGNHGLKIAEEQITGALAETIAARKASSESPQ